MKPGPGDLRRLDVGIARERHARCGWRARAASGRAAWPAPSPRWRRGRHGWRRAAARRRSARDRAAAIAPFRRMRLDDALTRSVKSWKMFIARSLWWPGPSMAMAPPSPNRRRRSNHRSSCWHRTIAGQRFRSAPGVLVRTDAGVLRQRRSGRSCRRGSRRPAAPVAASSPSDPAASPAAWPRDPPGSAGTAAGPSPRLPSSRRHDGVVPIDGAAEHRLDRAGRRRPSLGENAMTGRPPRRMSSGDGPGGAHRGASPPPPRRRRSSRRSAAASALAGPRPPPSRGYSDADIRRGCRRISVDFLERLEGQQPGAQPVVDVVGVVGDVVGNGRGLGLRPGVSSTATGRARAEYSAIADGTPVAAIAPDRAARRHRSAGRCA